MEKWKFCRNAGKIREVLHGLDKSLSFRDHIRGFLILNSAKCLWVASFPEELKQDL